MASALRSAASAAGRAARHGFSSRSPPTRHHQHSGDVLNRLNVVRKYSAGFPHPGPDGKPMDADEGNRSKILGRIEELDVKLKRKFVQDVEKLRRMTEDRNSLSRLLTLCGVPRGDIRDKLVLGCNLFGVFCVATAAGIFMAERDNDPEATPNLILFILGGK